jgi:hypothetical protein
MSDPPEDAILDPRQQVEREAKGDDGIGASQLPLRARKRCRGLPTDNQAHGGLLDRQRFLSSLACGNAL